MPSPLTGARKDSRSLSQDEIRQKAISLLKNEKTAWESATCFITDKWAINVRELIKVLRKNYFGVFDEQYDPNTGHKKIWVPLTESACDASLKNIDLDTKDINFRAKKQQALGLTSVIRNVVRAHLDEMNFGEYLDEFERVLCIDGTAVWKTYEETDSKGKKKLHIQLVDLLNFYIDPNARSIAESTVIERALLTPDEVRGMKGWIDTEDVEGYTDLPRVNDNASARINSGTKYVEVFERWGLMPKSLLTGKSEDEEELVEGRIVISGLMGGSTKVHLIEENKKGIKPYEEAWYTRVPGRWYGRGPAEKVMMLQIWLNTIVNIRIARSRVSQLGIFKIRKGSGITPQMISKLPANGAVVMNDPNDLQQLVVQEASQASYTDESTIQGWAERVTSTFESVTGESLPSSTPATNAAISSRAGQSQFVFIKKGIGMFLQRWIKNQALPTIIKNIKRDDIIRITSEVEELRDFDERIANQLLYKELEKLNKRGVFFDAKTVEREKQKILKKLAKMGGDRFVKLKDDIDFTEYDVQVYVTNEEMDKAVVMQNLVTVLQTVSSLPQSGIDPVAVARQIFDLMGVDATQLKAKQQALPQGQMPMAQMAQQMPQEQPMASPQAIATKANTYAPGQA